MTAKKCKLFLGGYVNSINAQNLNCRAIAQHLDTEKFEIFAMELPKGELPSLSSSIKIIQLFWPIKIVKYWAYFKAICWADVVYLPKGELSVWCRFWCWLLKTPSFSTAESVDDGTNWQKQLSFFGSKKAYIKHYSSFTALFSISAFLAERNRALHGIQYSGILPLGVDTSSFDYKQKESLKEVVLIGNNLHYKGWDFYLQLAAQFPLLTFHVVGSGLGRLNLEKESNHLNNLVLHGQLTHKQLNQLFKKIDLHILPSRSEGFPKVILECATAGIPSLVFADYGAREWLKAGFVVDTNDEMSRKLQYLIDNPNALIESSLSCKKFANYYSWKQLIKKWELIIFQLIYKG